MAFRRHLLLLVIGVFMALATQAPAFDAVDPHREIAWQPWSDSVFQTAKLQHKFVLLDLQAVWCHWCHVMDEKTYADPRVIALINSRYLAVRVDQDSRPDLANRYQDYGWPATVVFNADGGEIVKRQGYLPPEEMSSMLQAIIDDPTPGPSVVNSKSISLNDAASPANETELKRQLLAGYDAKLGSWGTVQKFLNWDNVEYCLVQARTGDAVAENMARQTLAAQLKLIDPIWGGVDQYSAEGDWDHPHFEKIMQMQAENMKIYAEAYAQWKDPVYLRTAQGIYGYVREFLTSPDGVVYTSQDADLVDGEHGGDYFKLDDAGRRKLGLPRIDRHIYARENGWFIQSLNALYQATGNARYRNEAVHAAEWIYRSRATGDGGFRHGDETSGPINLGDTLAMGRAFLGLYTVTADHAWLDQAEQAADFIDSHFIYRAHGAAIGFATAADESADSILKPEPDFDENVALARFANLLYHYTGNARDQRIAQTALRFAAAPEVAKSRLSSVGGLLLAEQEMAHDPLHIAIVGNRSDVSAHNLFKAAVTYPCIYKQVEWIDPSQKHSGPGSSIYPTLGQSAAYVCAQRSCSAPVFDPTQLIDLLNRKTASN
jgi:uncharacterized protein YyaL (SSP411 family)